MQNKGFVKFIAIVLTLICLFYLSFSFVTSNVESKAEKYGKAQAAKLASADMTPVQKDSIAEVAEKQYLDSIGDKPVYLGWKSYKECQALQIGLGLDLKGGMNVILEVSMPDVVKNLAGNTQDPTFNEAVNEADKEANKGKGDFVDLFVKKYQEKAGENKLGALFAAKLKDKNITYNSTDKEVAKALEDEIKVAVENSHKVVRTRIDRFGVAQPNIQVLQGKGQMGQIMVELPGIKDPERVSKLLRGSANLEFWETYDYSAVSPLIAGLNDLTTTSVGGAAPVVADTTAADTAAAVAAATPAKSEQKADGKRLSDLIMQNPYGSGCVVGYVLPKDTADVNRIIYSAAAKAKLPKDLVLAWGEKAEPLGDRNGQPMYALYALKATNGKPAMSGDVVTTATDEFNQMHQPVVSMEMNNSGAREWAKLTAKNVGHCVAIVLDGFVYSAPNVNTEITGGRSEISGHFTTDETRDLANVLSSGKMPAPTKIVSSETVGPSMGSQNIRAGFISCIIAFVLLMLFMCCYYGLIPGMVANMALLLNFFFTFGILISFQAALTMSGIAGMVLSLGMAVDANVLIYERTKEELRAGKNVKQAVAAGYGNAFSAIFDSNLTSIITAVILYYVGTGPIRGFAMTLGIGICASFFTAVWITRMVYEHFFEKDKWLNLTFDTKLTRGFLMNVHYNFLSKTKVAFAIFGALVLIGIASLLIRGLSKGIDFTGGRNFVVELVDKDTTPEAVEAAFKEAAKKDNPDANVDGTHAIRVITAENTQAVRLQTNYLIEEADEEADSKIEQLLYNALHDKGLVTASYDMFKNRDVHDGGSILTSQKVGNTVAKETTRGAVKAVILALIAIFLYILLRFRNVAFSVGSIVALTVDTFLIIAVYSLCHGWAPFSLEIDQTFIGAILTAIGYSINDKVVVFDRIRENLGLWPKRDTRRLFNDSLSQTLARTIMTSFTTLLVLLCIFILGGDSIRSFAFAMILGVIFGTLSSMFIAAPVAYMLFNKKIVNEADDDIEKK